MKMTHTACALALAAAAGGACASDPPRPRIEDQARLLAPIPACMASLPGARTAPAGMTRSLRNEYWAIVYPAYDDANHKLRPGALSCTGRSLQGEPEFAGTTPVDRPDERLITIGGGADGIRAVWLRSHRAPDGTEAGAIALVRAKDDAATVIAIGAHAGRPGARLSLERLDTELVLLVHDDGCTGKPASERCDTLLTVYLPRQGRLLPAARVVLEKVEFDVDSEPPLRGRFQYHLSTSPVFSKGVLRVVEHVSVRDQGGREVRWAEQERVYRVDVDRLEPGEEPLWARMYRPASAKR
jgi:hypothetical protein